MSLGERIEHFAKVKHISLRQLALESSINYNTLYSFVKRGGSRLPEDSLNSIAQALGITAEELEGENPSEKKLSDAGIALAMTIGGIVGDLTGEERDNMVLLINSFLKANTGFIRGIYDKLKKGDK